MEVRAEEQRKLYQDIIKMIAIEKAVSAFGDKQVKWAIIKYLESVRAKTRLLKDKKQADERLAELNRRFGV